MAFQPFLDMDILDSRPDVVSPFGYRRPENFFERLAGVVLVRSSYAGDLGRSTVPHHEPVLGIVERYADRHALDGAQELGLEVLNAFQGFDRRGFVRRTAAVAEKATVVVKYRLAAHPQIEVPAIWPLGAVVEVAHRLMLIHRFDMLAPEWIGSRVRNLGGLPTGEAQRGIRGAIAPRMVGEPMILVGFPEPVPGSFGKVAETSLTLRQGLFALLEVGDVRSNADDSAVGRAEVLKPQPEAMASP